MKRIPTWIKMIAFACVMIPVMNLLMIENPDTRDERISSEMEWWILGLILIAGGFCLALYLCYRHFQRQEYEAGLTKTLQLSETEGSVRGKTLYLRPFRIDGKKIETLEYQGNRYRGVESVICQGMANVGIPYAIKNSHDKAQALPGTAERVLGGEKWQDKVLEMMGEAELIVIYVEFKRSKKRKKQDSKEEKKQDRDWRKSGTMWEVEQALTRYKDKLILIPKLYHYQISRLTPLFAFVPFTFLYPLFSARVHHFWLSKTRRGFGYYPKWREILAEHIAAQDMRDMNDRVSAVVFEHGKAVFFKAESPTIEAQLDTVIDAIRYKARRGIYES